MPVSPLWVPIAGQFVAWQPFPVCRRATVHELALDWLDTYLRSSKRTIDGGSGGSGRVGAIKFTIAEGCGVRIVRDRTHARTFSRYRPMFIFDINLVDVCGPRLVRYIILINYFNEYKRNGTRAVRVLSNAFY